MLRYIWAALSWSFTECVPSLFLGKGAGDSFSPAGYIPVPLAASANILNPGAAGVFDRISGPGTGGD
jgi:hypothetical protein